MKATTSQKEIDELLNAIKTGHSKFILSIPVHTTHPMMMKNTQVIRQTLHFLKHGYFYRRQSS